MDDRINKVLDKSDNLDLLNDFFSENDSVYSYMGIKITKFSRGHCELEIPYSEKLLRAGKVLHGGMIMAALDYAGGLTTMTFNDGNDQVTQEIKINFLNPMYRGPFKITTDVIKAGKTAVVVELKLYDADGKIGTIALGTWYIIRDRIIQKK